jgi:hypothetical protein
MTTRPTNYELEQRLSDLEPGDHLCFIYNTEEESRALLASFVRQGLERNEKVLYVVDSHTAEQVHNYLQDDGIEVWLYGRTGQLRILTADEVYTREGFFDPDGMISLLRKETERAVDDGYSALRITGEMTWALRELPGSERLIEYEAKLNDFFHGSKCLAICQYERPKFEAMLLLDVLGTHPLVVIGTEILDNFNCVPSKKFSGPDAEAAKLNSWLNNLVKRKRAEEALRESKEKESVGWKDLKRP